MAGEWIKIEAATADKPEVLRMARLLKIDQDAVFGKLVRLWSWFDSNSVDGVVDGAVDADVDRLCHCSGFAAACISVGWLEFDPATERLTLPNFERHNGETAKKRALKNRRQAKWRASVDGSVDDSVDGAASTSASTREEKRREEKKKQKQRHVQRAARFDDFWAVYPEKKGKAAALKSWKAKDCDAIADQIINHVLLMQDQDEGWRNGFIPHGSTYVNGERWHDVPTRGPPSAQRKGQESKTMGAIKALEGMKNGLDDTRDHNGFPEASLPQLGTYAGH